MLHVTEAKAKVPTRCDRSGAMATHICMERCLLQADRQ